MSRPRVGLFATCLVDLFRPQTGLAAAELLERAGCEVVVPKAQTCCGQPAWNSGDRATTRALALALIDAFADVDAVVAPSGSCIGMLRQFPDVLGATDPRQGDAEALAAKSFELFEYLVDERGYRPEPLADPPTVTYHDSCAGLRECGIKGQPRALMAAAGVELKEMDAAEVCCGFGGTFCVKYPDISAAMTDAKVASIERSGAPLVTGGDLGCLLNIVGRLTRDERTVQARHLAEVLVGDEGPPLGEGAS
ncbi:MAG: (Fe-S)-binding protein [Pseudomonadales bacterium]|jgi:L-lactate dehydrogenase complex protein LldE|nr:(Fe-S)-binding protein [Pseudomonadales bacterium]